MATNPQAFPRFGDLDHDRLAAAVETNFWEFFSLLGAWPRFEVHDDPTVSWFRSDIPFPLFNGVFRARLHPETTDAAIAAHLAHFMSPERPMLWWVGPTSTPVDLGTRLEAHGLIQVDKSPGMAADLDALPADPARLLTERVTDAATMQEWVNIFGAGFELPPFVVEATEEVNLCVGLGGESRLRHYLARIDSQPVASTTLMLGAEVAGIYNVATLSTHRQRGAGTAVTLAALQDARQLGYHVAALAASTMGYNLYRRLGFADVCTFTQYYAGPMMDEGSSG